MANEINRRKSVRRLLLVLLGLSTLFLTSCLSSNSDTLAEFRELSVTNKITLSPGDVVEVKFRFWPELNEVQAVRPDGKISLQLVDEVHVLGLTPEELDKQLTDLYESKLKNPDITVFVRQLANQNVFVGGEVMNPGLFPIQGGVTPLQAVFNAGGFNEMAKPEETIVVRKGKNNRPIPIKINLAKIIDGDKEYSEIMLQPNDIVYVPKTTIAKLNKFVYQYIERLLLFRGVSLGFSYQLHDANDDNED